MATFDNLLGFKDLSEALFAESQLLTDAKRFPAYGVAQQGKMAELEQAVDALQQAPATAGIAVGSPADVALNADSLGNILGGLPFTVTVSVTLLGSDVLSDPRTEVVFTADGVVGSETSEGVYEVTNVTKLTARLIAAVSFAGVPQLTRTVNITVTKAAPPPVQTPPAGTPAPPPTPPSMPTPALSVLLTPAQTDSFALVGVANVNGGFAYAVALNSDFYAPVATGIGSNIEAYVAYRVGSGAWTTTPVVEGFPAVREPRGDIGPSPFQSQLQYDVTPGFISVTRTIVAPSGNVQIGIFARLVYGEAVTFGSPAIIQPG